MKAAALLASPTATPAEIEAALEAVVHGDATSEFVKAFGPRRLVKALASGRLTDRAAELADELLSAAGATVGLAPSLEFTDVLHHEELYPDEVIDLSSDPPSTPPAAIDEACRLHLRLGGGSGAAFWTPSGRVVWDAPTEAAAVAIAEAPTLRLANPSRRYRIGSEIECKVWPAAVMLGRWLWQHQQLVRGRSVLELGCGVGTAGLAAAKCGASLVAMTDINPTALRCARENSAKNGARVQQAVRVAWLDWAQPPVLEAAPAPALALADGCGMAASSCAHDGASAHDGAPEDESCASLLRERFEVIVLADVVNAEGLPELVYRMLKLYLAPEGLVLMACPKPRHRHTVERLCGLLLEGGAFEARLAEMPAWATQGLEEAAVIEHQLVLAQWARGAEPSSPAPLPAA